MELLPFISRFNSKLVRLKAKRCAASEVPISWFQFQTGAIKRNAELPVSAWKSVFQFQTGAIKRCHQCPNTVSPSPCFNSKLVRLKALRRGGLALGLRGFNSKLVRLKVDVTVSKFRLGVSFNSKLVRLKEARRLAKAMPR